METETKQCQNCKADFKIESDDFSFYTKMGLPVPGFCPQCRFQRRLAHRNDRSLYRRECDLCKKKIISIYHIDSVIKKVYCPECWWSDNWDTLENGVDYDFNKDFFTQYFQFKRSIPHQSVYQSKFVDSEYCNFGTEYRNCYLVFGGYKNENVSYSTFIGDTRESIDITLSLNIELSAEVINCFRSSKLAHCHSCEDSSELTMCVDCHGCISCFGCVGLRNKQHCIFNEQYTKTEYENKLKELNIGNYNNFIEIKKSFNEFMLKHTFKYNRNKNSVDCDGDDVRNSKSSHQVFWGSNLEDVKYTFFVVNSKDSYDLTGIGSTSGVSEQLYEISSSFGGYNQIVGIRTLFDRNSFYSEDCHNCNDIFGCIGLKKKSYCIFNKQYSKEEYETLLPKILKQINDMPYIDKKGRQYTFGDFWPIEFSPFGYNETKGQEYFYLTKEEIIDQGYNFYNKEDSNYNITVRNSEIPVDIKFVNEDITKEIMECEHKGDCKHLCTKAFKILSSDLQVLKNLNLPLPRACPNCRYYERLAKQNPINLWHRSCMCDLSTHGHEGKCEVEFETSYSPERKEIIYCEKCYQQEVV